MGAMGERGIRFVDVARSQGVRRFVLLSASIIEQGGEAMGKTHEYLASLRGIEYSVLRPTWFMRMSLFLLTILVTLYHGLKRIPSLRKLLGR